MSSPEQFGTPDIFKRTTDIVTRKVYARCQKVFRELKRKNPHFRLKLKVLANREGQTYTNVYKGRAIQGTLHKNEVWIEVTGPDKEVTVFLTTVHRQKLERRTASADNPDEELT